MPDLSTNGHSHDDIHQATEIVSVQGDCDLIEAFDKLRERAAALGQNIEHTARDVLDGVIRFDEWPAG